MSAPLPVRVLLVDSEVLVRAGLRLLIESQPGLTVVGEADASEVAVQTAAASGPDVILLNLQGDDAAASLLPRLLAAAPGAQALVLMGERDPETHAQVVRLGAMGVVLREKSPQALFKAIEKVHAGEVWLDRRMTAGVISELAGRHARTPDPESARIASITERERAIITLVTEGLKNKQIGARLSISETTVRHHLTSIFDKLNVTDRFALVIYAYRNGLAKPPI